MMGWKERFSPQIRNAPNHERNPFRFDKGRHGLSVRNCHRVITQGLRTPTAGQELPTGRAELQCHYPRSSYSTIDGGRRRSPNSKDSHAAVVATVCLEEYSAATLSLVRQTLDRVLISETCHVMYCISLPRVLIGAPSPRPEIRDNRRPRAVETVTKSFLTIEPRLESDGQGYLGLLG
ncbi:hypothetical protein VTN96DRAFT_1524 [Rasamsonia emersonii]